MAGKVSLQIIGNWNKEIGVPLRDALAVSMDVMGRTGEEACKHALILMAQSARALTPQARKNRKVHKDPNGRYIEFYRGGGTGKLYEWQAKNFDAARVIKNRGLAKRSWMWGIDALGARGVSKAIAGAGTVRTITSETLNGYVKENALSYVAKIMPAGWESTVEIKAGNKIMAQARQRLERQWKSSMRRRERRLEQSVSRFFTAALSI